MYYFILLLLYRSKTRNKTYCQIKTNKQISKVESNSICCPILNPVSYNHINLILTKVGSWARA